MIDYFGELGIYDGENLDFESIPELGYKAALKSFFKFATASILDVPDLLTLSAEELIDTKLTLEDVEGLRRRFKYLKEVVERYY